MTQIPEVTVHGRFQPPLHVNHWEYVKVGFEIARHVTILITNPFQDESFEATASWRNDPVNNPFTYEERTEMFNQFFSAIGIDSYRYTFKPFNIKKDAAFAELNMNVPNLVNVYSEWSEKKVDTFENHGLKVIRLEQPKSKPVSGTLIREIIQNTEDISELPRLLNAAGFMQQAVQGLIEVLSARKK